MKREDLINTKVYVNGRSAEIQRKLFELGFSWGNKIKDVLYADKPFLFMDEVNGRLSLAYSSNMDHFLTEPNREITADYILNIPVEPELKPIFYPFQKVLVRDENNEVWEAQFFSNYEDRVGYEEFPYCCIGNAYKQIIPYEGNEHLLNTCNYPDTDR